jgi:hypothetical protein
MNRLPRRLLTVLGLALLLVAGATAQAATGDTAPHDSAGASRPPWLEGRWGTGPADLGIRLPAPDALPHAPFMGPGGFRVDRQGRLWVTDSVQGLLKRRAPAQPTWDQWPPPGQGLADLDLTDSLGAVAMKHPAALYVFDLVNPASGTLWKGAWKSPGRIRLLHDSLAAVEETSGGIWLVTPTACVRHPTDGLEPIGHDAKLFGTIFDFEESARSIIVASATLEPSEPDLLALLRLEGRKIVFSRLLACANESPLLSIVVADDPGHYALYRVNDAGTCRPAGVLPVFPGPYLASSWTLASDGWFYGFAGDLNGFQIWRYRPE